MKKLLISSALLSILAFSSVSNATSQNSETLTNEMNALIQDEQKNMPTDFEAMISVDTKWEITEIKIPFPRCQKVYERISFDIPEFKWAITKILGIKMHFPKIYSKRQEIKFDYPRCSKDYKVVKLHLPQVSNARSDIDKKGSNIKSIAEKYQPLIEAAAFSEIKKDIKLQRDTLENEFNQDIASLNIEISNSKSGIQKKILISQRTMMLDVQSITLEEFDKQTANLG